MDSKCIIQNIKGCLKKLNIECFHYNWQERLPLHNFCGSFLKAKAPLKGVKVQGFVKTAGAGSLFIVFSQNPAAAAETAKKYRVIHSVHFYMNHALSCLCFSVTFARWGFGVLSDYICSPGDSGQINYYFMYKFSKDCG